MCAVSMIYDYGQKTWPLPPAPMIPTQPFQPFQPSLPTREQIDEFQKLVKAAREFDRKTGQPDCEDPRKVEWLKQIMDRLDAIEKKLDAKA